MNYLQIYNKLIECAKGKHREKGSAIYYEKHHILPVSWGGSDEEFNLVLLTAKEHWIAHLLLAKFATGQNKYKAYQAVVNMGRVIDETKRKTSRLYASARQHISVEVSHRHKNTLIVKDRESGIRIGRVSKDHPKVLSGEWIFFHNGMTRSEEYKEKVGKSIGGELNGRYCGMTNEQIIERCVEVYKKYGYWTYTITRYYCSIRYGETIPLSVGGKYRTPIKHKAIKKHLFDNCGASIQHFDTFAKHQTNRILQEIENEFKN